ncbi:LacI family transcriptional regulator [Sphaerisporangium melleum]|uniref:LacI family transcriptional regulator n=1 Tax=Sphaerisporangium melleum TaxID=321316 RepID=A0A917QXM8_9ACTN|nr:LacI family DNA-binding transcriptional regulator [Sphaerisporangium melleum]GGK74553.1 LacI family transcriptional regulator [Sphaerisporangium melleum]GII70933.1 LacI family transcriptional regulator [Sphaerisporangium melleum]
MAEVGAPVTMSDVARAAGVSTATVSRVVNGRYGVSASTIAQVRSAIERLGYESSLVATSLRRSRTNVLGLVTHSFQSYTAEVLKGVMQALSRSGFDLIIYANSDLYETYSEGWEQRHLTRLAGTLTDGCIVVTPWGEVRSSIPVVVIDPVKGSSVPSVTADNLAGATSVVEHLLALGHRRIGFIAGRSRLEAAWSREEGYRRALVAAGVPVDPELIGRGDFNPESAAPLARALLERPDPPTAIFAASDGMALKVLEVAKQMGLVVPRDLSVVGFDNIPESALAEPGLTTVDQSMYRLGYEAARMLKSLVTGEWQGDRRLLLPTGLVIRGSTSPPASTVEP